MCDPLGSSPVIDATRWGDNRFNASQNFYTKRMVFGYSDSAANSSRVFHTGSKLKYMIWTNEPSYTKVCLFLVKPKKNQSDQLTLDRNLMGRVSGQQAGTLGQIVKDVDYTVHDGSGDMVGSTLWGAELNHKYWTVLYKREVSLSNPQATEFLPEATASTSDPANNSLVASGTIRIPAGGVLRSVGQATHAATDASSPAFEQQFVDQRREDSVYLVVIQNDSTLDNQQISMGFTVNDYYKAVV